MLANFTLSRVVETLEEVQNDLFGAVLMRQAP